MEPLTVVPVGQLPRSGADLLEATYDDAFPAELRVPFADLAVDHVLAFVEPSDPGSKPGSDPASRPGSDPGSDPVGLAVVRDLGEAAVFLRYFVAVHKGGGSGTRMWAALEDWTRARDAAQLLLDVEDPAEEIADAEESDVRRRRVAFYERNGAQVLPVSGYAPDHALTQAADCAAHQGPGHAPAMQLLLAEVDIAPHARAPLPRERLRGVLLEVLTGRYGYAADAPDVHRLLDLNGLS